MDVRTAELRELYDRWSPLVYSLALERLGRPAVAEEVTRQVFVRAWADGPSRDAASVRPPSWLLDLVRSTIDGVDGDSDVASHASPPPEPADLEDGGSARESKSDRLTELLMSDAMSRLDPVREQVLRMALVERLAVDQIAARTQLSVPVVKDHLFHGLAALRDACEVGE